MNTTRRSPHPMPKIVARDLQQFLVALDATAADLRAALAKVIHSSDEHIDWHCDACTRLALRIQRYTDRLWILRQKILTRHAKPPYG